MVTVAVSLEEKYGILLMELKENA